MRYVALAPVSVVPRRTAPAAAKLRRGITRPSRVNLAEPVAKLTRPEPPDDLDDVARAVWLDTLDEAPPGMIVKLDAPLLRAYCEAFSRYLQAQKLYAVSGALIRSTRRSGEIVRNPVGYVIARESEQLVRLARELGLSPAARAGLRVTILDRRDDISDVLGPPPRLTLAG